MLPHRGPVLARLLDEAEDLHPDDGEDAGHEVEDDPAEEGEEEDDPGAELLGLDASPAEHLLDRGALVGHLDDVAVGGNRIGRG